MYFSYNEPRLQRGSCSNRYRANRLLWLLVREDSCSLQQLHSSRYVYWSQGFRALASRHKSAHLTARHSGSGINRCFFLLIHFNCDIKDESSFRLRGRLKAGIKLYDKSKRSLGHADLRGKWNLLISWTDLKLSSQNNVRITVSSYNSKQFNKEKRVCSRHPLTWQHQSTRRQPFSTGQQNSRDVIRFSFTAFVLTCWHWPGVMILLAEGLPASDLNLGKCWFETFTVCANAQQFQG